MKKYLGLISVVFMMAITTGKVWATESSQTLYIWDVSSITAGADSDSYSFRAKYRLGNMHGETIRTVNINFPKSESCRRLIESQQADVSNVFQLALFGDHKVIPAASKDHQDDITFVSASVCRRQKYSTDLDPMN